VKCTIVRHKYPNLWDKLLKLDRIKDYNTLLNRINKGMDMQTAISTPIKGREYKIAPIKVEHFIPFRYRHHQNFNKSKYYENEQEIERQILFDKRQLTYSLDELSCEEKLLIK
jgi:hypothetical protein